MFFDCDNIAKLPAVKRLQWRGRARFYCAGAYDRALLAADNGCVLLVIGDW